MESKLCQTK